MYTASNMFTVTLNGCIDEQPFNFQTTSDGEMMVMSGGMHSLIHKAYWGPIQKQCPDLGPTGNNRQWVPISWALSVTANPPQTTNPKHRRILRLVHLICLEALKEGVNFAPDKIFLPKHAGFADRTKCFGVTRFLVSS